MGILASRPLPYLSEGASLLGKCTDDLGRYVEEEYRGNEGKGEDEYNERVARVYKQDEHKSEQ